jgi:hypothetical protein
MSFFYDLEFQNLAFFKICKMANHIFADKFWPAWKVEVSTKPCPPWN